MNTFWIFKTGAAEMEVRKEKLTYEKTYELIGCKWVERLSFGDYQFFMDEEPKNKPNNACLEKALGISIKGDCLVCKMTTDNEGESIFHDMDMDLGDFHLFIVEENQRKMMRMAARYANAHVINIGGR